MRSSKSGFTLAEIVVVVGIFSLMTIAINNFGGDIFRYNRIIGSGLNAQQDARQILRVMAGELRTASPSASGAFALVEVADNALTFYSDYNKNGTIEKIRYYLSGSNLMKSVVEPSGSPVGYTGSASISTLMKNLSGSNPIFQYYDATYDGTNVALVQPVNANLVRLIKIALTIDSDPNSAPTPIIVSTQVQLRNLKDNL